MNREQIREVLEEVLKPKESEGKGAYAKSLKEELWDPKRESLEFLQYAGNVLDRALVTTAIGVLEVEMPCASGEAWSILRVGKSTYRIGKPYALSNVASAQKAEKAEAHIAGLGDVDYADGECLCYAEKELVTNKAIRQLGYPLVGNVTSILTRMVNLPIEKAVIDEMKKATCQTASATACWDTATPSITKDLEIGRRALQAKGYPRDTHVLIVSDYDFSSMLLFLQSKGFMGMSFEASKPYVSKYFDLPIINEANLIDTTAILDDTAILFAKTPKAGVLVESESLKVRTWIDQNLDGTWIEVSRESKPERLDNNSVYTITNTVT